VQGRAFKAYGFIKVFRIICGKMSVGDRLVITNTKMRRARSHLLRFQGAAVYQIATPIKGVI